MKTMSALVMSVALFAVSVFAEGLLPGYLTDPTANWKELPSDGYVTPDHLKYPYLSTYYVKPTLVEGESCKIAFYVTDFDHSLWRFGDGTRRFDVTLRLTTDRRTFRTESVKDVPSGDGAFDLGKLPVGDYIVGVVARDRLNGLCSHTVWQEFRVVGKSSLEIPSSKTKVVSSADLKAYGIVADPGYERVKLVEVPEDPAIHHKNNFYVKNKELAEMYRKFIDDYLAQHPHKAPGGTPGYTVYAPSWKGVALDRAYQRRRVVYDPDYDKARVAAEAEANSLGFARLVAEAWTNGFRKIVLAPGTYRVSHKHTLAIPDGTTLDMNGAVLKLNGFVGEKSLMVKLAAVTDAHLVNGTLEGDYWEHDYDAKESGGSEWVCGFSIQAMSRYCSVERVNIRLITGYGGCNGSGKEGPGVIIRGEPFYNVGAWLSVGGKTGPMEPGGLAADGSVDASDKAQWTSPFTDITAFVPWKFLTVNKALGYQGIRTRGWNYVVAFYDAEKKFLSREVAFQYRDVLVPLDAVYARFSIEVANEEEAKKNDLSISLWKNPKNCAVAHCVYDRCRAVGHASAGMKNFLFDENEFMHSGESLATCAYDAEDGWDQMQDVLFVGNNFHDNNRSELLSCAGHNFMMVKNHARISLSARTFSPFVAENDCVSANFPCGNRTRTGYARYLGNTYRKSLTLGGEHSEYKDWDAVISDLAFPPAGSTNRLVITGGATGRFRNCTFRNQEIRIPTAERCTFADCQTGMMRWSNGRWMDCVATNCTFTRTWSTNVFVNCSFPDCKFQSAMQAPQKFVGCDLTGMTFSKRLDPAPEFENCKGQPGPGK